MGIGTGPKVLEIGSYSAAYCGRLWVRAGADVVQVRPKEEHPTATPGWVSATATDTFTDAGKRRVELDSPEQLAELAERADIVIAEARTADSLQVLGFDDWSTNVKLSITPFGRTGPKRNWQATPSVLLAMGGYTNVIGDPNRAPLTLPGHYVEFQTGALAYGVSQAAHFAGKTDEIDLGMLEVVASLHHYTSVRYHADGQIRQRRGSDLWFVVPSDLFACLDGWVYLTVTPAFWEMFVLLLDRPELTLDERFANNDLRMQNRDELRAIIADVFSAATCAELERKAEEFRVPLGTAQTPAEVLADRHLAERDFWETLTISDDESSETSSSTTVQSPGLPWRGLEAFEPKAAVKPVSGSELW